MTTFKSPPIHRTPLYRAKAAYCNMIARCENANGKSPAYTNVKLNMSLDEWLAWAVPRYEAFMAEYPNERPVVSRNGDVGHYEIGNIEIISFAENYRRQSHPAPARNQHGTLSSHRYCRCVLCREAKAKYMREWKKSRRGRADDCTRLLNGT